MVPTDPAARTQEASWGRTALLVWARSTLSCSLFLVAIILESLIAGPAMPWEVLPALPLVALLAPLYAVPMAGFSSAISWLLALVRRAYSAVVGNLIVTFPLLLTLGYVWLMLFVLSYAMWFLAIAVTCLGDPLWGTVRRILPNVLVHDLKEVWFNPYVVVVKTDSAGGYDVVPFSEWWGTVSAEITS